MKKGTPSKTRGARKTAPRTPKKPFRLEVGKTYESRCGEIIKITEFYPERLEAFRYMGVGVVHENHCLAWIENGLVYHGRENPDDLIREVPSPRPRSRKGARRA